MFLDHHDIHNNLIRHIIIISFCRIWLTQLTKCNLFFLQYRKCRENFNYNLIREIRFWHSSPGIPTLQQRYRQANVGRRRTWLSCPPICFSIWWDFCLDEITLQVEQILQLKIYFQSTLILIVNYWHSFNLRNSIWFIIIVERSKYSFITYFPVQWSRYSQFISSFMHHTYGELDHYVFSSS